MASINSLYYMSATKVLENFEKSIVKQELFKSSYSIRKHLVKCLNSNVQMKEHKKINC